MVHNRPITASKEMHQMSRYPVHIVADISITKHECVAIYKRVLMITHYVNRNSVTSLRKNILTWC